MRVYCYETWADMPTQEQLWLCSEAVHAGPGSSARFYIREDKRTFALVIDPSLRHIVKQDYLE